MLVIFDCDGVLVDSETLASEVFSSVLARYGVVMTPEQCFSVFKGHTLPNCMAWLAKQKNAALPSGFLDELSDATATAFGAALTVSPGVFEVLEYLKNNAISFCVASNGSRSKIDRSLSLTGLHEYFGLGCRFSAEDVPQGKPAPDLFLHAAESMGVPPLFCCVVEDSATGIAAANAAGIKAYAYIPAGEQASGTLGSKSSYEYEIVVSMAHLLARFKALR